MLTTVTVLLNRLLIPTAIAVASLAACASAANYESLPPIADNARELRIRTDYFAPLFPGAATAYVVTSGQVIVHSYDGLRWTSHEIRTPVADEILTMAPIYAISMVAELFARSMLSALKWKEPSMERDLFLSLKLQMVVRPVTAVASTTWCTW